MPGSKTSYSLGATTILRLWPCRFPAFSSLVVFLALCLVGTVAPAVAAQEGTVGGVVVDKQTLQPVLGAQVVVAGTQQGAMTDANGRFRITGLSGTEASLEVRLIGFRPVTQTVAIGTLDARIELTAVAISLDQVVVTGTAGGSEQRAIGNVVARVEASDIVKQAPVTSVQQLLTARAPGVVILPGSGNVGTGGATRVRGVASLSLTNEPLLYIDGVRVNNSTQGGPDIRQGRQVSRINDLNPEDIESIEIIKGPAAATLYGTEASSGVIQIITKKGKSGAPAFDVSVRQGVNWLMDPEEKVPTLYGKDSTGALVGVNLYTREKEAGRDPLRTGRLDNYSASLRGGTDLIRYYLSGDLDKPRGVVSYNWQERYSGRANLTVVPNPKITVDGNLGYTNSKTRFGQAASGWDLWGNMVWGSPAQVSSPTRGFLRAPPNAAAEIESYSDVDRVVGSLQVSHSPWSWFTHRLTLGTDVGVETNSILFPRNPAGSNYFFGVLSLGQKSEERQRTGYQTVDYGATATANLPWFPSVTSATSVGFQSFSKRVEFVSALGKQFPAPSVKSIGGAAITTSSEDIIENKTVGVYVQEQLGFSNRVFVTAALRGDDNSAFGSNYSAAIYPKFSASWVLSEEPFWKISQVNTLKLRAAYGWAGKQPDVFAAQRLYQPATGPGDISVLTPQAIGNPDLKPEVGRELEVGLDAGLFDDRIQLNLTMFRQKTTDAIVERRVVPSLGFPGVQFVNVGSVANNGFEVGLNAQVLDRRNFALTLGGSFATNHNEVLDLGGLPPILLGSAQEERVGYPVASYFTKRIISAELDANGDPINVLCAGADGSGVPCAAAPNVFWGTPTPRWEGTVNSTVTLWRNLRLYGLVEFRGGFLINYGDVGAQHLAFHNSKSIQEGTNPILMAYDQLGVLDPVSLFDGGFAKLREISATYTLSPNLASKLHASGASLSVAGRNLATLWVAQKDIFGQRVPDPEVRTPGAELSGYVQTVMPPYSQFVVTLRLNY